MRSQVDTVLKATSGLVGAVVATAGDGPVPIVAVDVGSHLTPINRQLN